MDRSSQRRSFRFGDADLQARFMAELCKTTLPFEVRGDGAVVCADTEWTLLNGVAHKVRDSCFRWYLTWWMDLESPLLFLKELQTSGLPFQVEYHDDKMVFLSPKGSEDLHEVISDQVQMRAPVEME